MRPLLTCTLLLVFCIPAAASGPADQDLVVQDAKTGSRLVGATVVEEWLSEGLVEGALSIRLLEDWSTAVDGTVTVPSPGPASGVAGTNGETTSTMQAERILLRPREAPQDMTVLARDASAAFESCMVFGVVDGVRLAAPPRTSHALPGATAGLAVTLTPCHETTTRLAGSFTLVLWNWDLLLPEQTLTTGLQERPTGTPGVTNVTRTVAVVEVTAGNATLPVPSGTPWLSKDAVVQQLGPLAPGTARDMLLRPTHEGLVTVRPETAAVSPVGGVPSWLPWILAGGAVVAPGVPCWRRARRGHDVALAARLASHGRWGAALRSLRGHGGIEARVLRAQSYIHIGRTDRALRLARRLPADLRAFIEAYAAAARGDASAAAGHLGPWLANRPEFRQEVQANPVFKAVRAEEAWS